MIKQNAHKYSVSAMCKVLNVNRSTYYYESKPHPIDNSVKEAIVKIFESNRRVYGTRKIKVEVTKLGLIVSRRRIARLMKKNGLVSVYTIAQFKPHKTMSNESDIKNELNREFQKESPLLIDLFNREIIGHSCGQAKDAKLVHRAFAKVKGNLFNIQLFHTDRGSEFNNHLIDEVVNTFGIKRSLSMKGCPYDNAVSEATYKVIKTEFVKNQQFETIDDLKKGLDQYVKWFNERRIHSTLGYLSPLEFKSKALKKVV